MADFKSLAEKYDDMQAKYALKAATCREGARLTNENRELKQTVAMLTESVSNANALIVDLKKSLDEAAKYKTELDAPKAQNQQTANKMCVTGVFLETKLAQSLSAWRKELEDKNTKIAELTLANAGLREANTYFSERHDVCTRALDEYQRKAHMWVTDNKISETRGLEIAKLKKQLEESASVITNLNDQLNEHKIVHRMNVEKLTQFESNCNYQRQINEYKTAHGADQVLLADKQKTINSQVEKITELKSIIDGHRKALEDRKIAIAQGAKTDIELHADAVHAKTIEDQKATIAALREENDNQSGTIASLYKTVNDQKVTIATHFKRVEDQAKTIRQNSDLLADRSETICQLTHENTGMQGDLRHLRGATAMDEQLIKSLKVQIVTLGTDAAEYVREKARLFEQVKHLNDKIHSMNQSCKKDAVLVQDLKQTIVTLEQKFSEQNSVISQLRSLVKSVE